MNQVTSIILAVVVTAVITVVAVRMSDSGDGGKCDIHPQLTDQQMATVKANIDRARSQAFNAALADHPGDKDAGNRAGEDAAFDTLVHDLRPAIFNEYLKHRESLDGCF